MSIREALELAIKTAYEARSTKTIDIHGGTYSLSFNGPPRRIMQPAVETMEGRTISGLIDYVRYADIKKEGGHAIHVASPAKVSVVGDITVDGIRMVPYEAQAIVPETSNRQLTVEQAIPYIMTRFAAGGDRDPLLCALGNIETGERKTITDDGVSQTVAIRGGARLATREISNPVMLSAYKSFPSIDVEPAPYIVRIHDSSEVKVSIHYTGDSRWELDAMAKISERLSKAKLGLPIIC